MDSLGSQWADRNGGTALDEDDAADELPPVAIGHAERRLQARAYNFWASLLADRRFPSTGDLAPEALSQFAPYAALLDIHGDSDDPVIRHCDAALVQDCFGTVPATLSAAPPHSLLSRLAAHLEQVVGSEAPVGFEAEFVNGAGATILYRGILLPFSSDDVTVDSVLCVINWKELLETRSAKALQQEIAAHLGAATAAISAPARGTSDGARWCDGPANGRSGEDEDRRHLYERLRRAPGIPLSAICAHGEEFTLLLARRDEAGVAVIGEVSQEPRVIARAARRLLG